MAGEGRATTAEPWRRGAGLRKRRQLWVLPRTPLRPLYDDVPGVCLSNRSRMVSNSLLALSRTSAGTLSGLVAH